MALIGQAVSEKKIFENGGRRTDGRRTDGRTDGRTPDHGHPISSPCEPDGSGELKKKKKKRKKKKKKYNQPQYIVRIEIYKNKPLSQGISNLKYMYCNGLKTILASQKNPNKNHYIKAGLLNMNTGKTQPLYNTFVMVQDNFLVSMI